MLYYIIYTKCWKCCSRVDTGVCPSPSGGVQYMVRTTKRSPSAATCGGPKRCPKAQGFLGLFLAKPISSRSTMLILRS